MPSPRWPFHSKPPSAPGDVSRAAGTTAATLAPARNRVSGWAVVAAVACVLGGALSPARVEAQCGAIRSSCSACHDGVKAAQPSGDAWHVDHAFADICAACHGGVADAGVPEVAHVGLVDPLGGSGEACRPCHGESTAAHHAQYEERLAAKRDAGTTSAASPPPSASRAGSTSGASRGWRGEPGANRTMAVLAGAVGLAALVFVSLNERGRRRAGAPSEGGAGERARRGVRLV